jgi:hypothetical protein
MLITAMEIENFKGISDRVRIDLKPVTLLFGANSAGKSTIIQALHYAHEIFERGNLNPGKTIRGGSTIDLGGFENLVYNRDLARTIKLHFEGVMEDQDDLPQRFMVTLWEESAAPYGQLLEKNIKFSFEIEVSWSEIEKKPFVQKYQLSLNGDLPIAIIQSLHPNKVFISPSGELQRRLFRDDENSDLIEMFRWWVGVYGCEEYIVAAGSVFEIGLDMPSALPMWGQSLVFKYPFDGQPDERRYPEGYSPESNMGWTFVAFLNIMFVRTGELLCDALGRFLYLGPLREIPSRSFLLERSPEQARWASGLAAWDVLQQATDDFIDEFNKWFTGPDHLNTGYSIFLSRFKEVEDNSPLMLAIANGLALDDDERIADYLNSLPTKTRLYLRDEKTGITLLPHDIGIGISQLAPVIVLALHAQNSLAVIEQPELHIHPALQVALGDLFITQAKAKNNVFLLETHSEHLLLRLLRRIRETHEDELPPGVEGLTPENLAIYYIEPGDSGMKVRKLEVDETGDSSNKWPDGFFEERHGELY